MEDNYKSTQNQTNSVISAVVNSFLKTFLHNEILSVFLFNQKLSLDGNLTAFKLCVILCDDADKFKAERKIYLNAESNIPFDVVCYSHKQWNYCTKNPQSFAGKILKTGSIIYEQTTI